MSIKKKKKKMVQQLENSVSQSTVAKNKEILSCLAAKTSDISKKQNKKKTPKSGEIFTHKVQKQQRTLIANSHQPLRQRRV